MYRYIVKIFIVILGILSFFASPSLQAKGRASDTLFVDSVLNAVKTSLKADKNLSLKYLYRALSLTKGIAVSKRTLRVYEDIGYLYFDMGINDSALYYFLINLKGAESIENPGAVANAYDLIGRVYDVQNDTAKAMYYFRQSKSLYRSLNSQEGVSSVNTGIANLMDNHGRSREALALYLENIEYYKSTKLSNKLMLTYLNIGACYLNLKKPDTAMRYNRLALQMALKAQNYGNIGTIYINISNLKYEEKDNDSAVWYGLLALSISRKYHDADAALISLENLAEFYDNIGESSKAYKLQIQAGALKDSMINTEKIKTIERLRTVYETEKKDHQITEEKILSEKHRRERNLFLIISLLSIFLFGGAFYVFQQRSRIRLLLTKKAEEKQREKLQNLLSTEDTRFTEAIIHSQASERDRIASELHDGLGALLATVKLMFSSINKDHLDDGPQQLERERFENAFQLLDSACTEVRRIAHDLKSDATDFTLVHALTDLKNNIIKSRPIDFQLSTYQLEGGLPDTMELEIYRIIQELISNILKHADAKSIHIQLDRMDDTLHLIVEDDGKGMDPGAMKNARKGIGLVNIEQRLNKLGGIYQIDSQPGRGTAFLFEIPIYTYAEASR